MTSLHQNQQYLLKNKPARRYSNICPSPLIKKETNISSKLSSKSIRAKPKINTKEEDENLKAWEIRFNIAKSRSIQSLVDLEMDK